MGVMGRPLVTTFLNVGPSGVCVLPLGIAAERSVRHFGPSGVCGLPLGVEAERIVHYFCDNFSFFLSSFSTTYFSPRSFGPLIAPRRGLC
jgi:hypothetical protein